jgi:hypothetical protein
MQQCYLQLTLQDECIAPDFSLARLVRVVFLAHFKAHCSKVLQQQSTALKAAAEQQQQQ